MLTETETVEITLIRRAYVALLKASYGLTATSTLLMVLTALLGSYWLAPQIGLWTVSLFIGMRLSLDIRLFGLFLDLPEPDRETVIPKVLTALVGRCAPSRRLQEQAQPFSREKGARTWLVRQGCIVAMQLLLFLTSSIALLGHAAA